MKHRHHLLSVALLLALTACGGGKPETAPASSPSTSSPSTSGPSATRTPSAAGASSAARTPSASPTGWVPTSAAYPDVCRSALPQQARDTLGLIAKGGPYPYRSDGIVFENREGRLPREKNGYYHEYTVITPGAPTRGARRIVTGGAGQQYWTEDHYDSFAEVDPRC